MDVRYRSASLIQNPTTSAAASPDAITGAVGGHCVNWLATNTQRMKQPTAMTMPPTREAMLRWRGAASRMVIAMRYCPAIAVARAPDRTFGKSRRTKRLS
jgi:hypothetical protein